MDSVLDLLTRERLGEHPRLAVGMLEAVMLFPGDLPTQRQCVRAAQIEHLGPQREALSSACLRDLVDALLEERASGLIGLQHLRGKIRRRFAGGFAVGLEVAVALAQTGTFQETRQFMANRLSGSRAQSSLGFTLSVSSIANKYAPEFRPVAHFWAVYVQSAYVLRQQGHSQATSFPCASLDLVDFLRAADEVRRLAEGRKSSPTSNVPIMEPGAALRIPPSLGILEAGAQT